MNVSLAKAPLPRSMTAHDGFLLILGNLFEEIDLYRGATLTTSEPEPLHKLRITIRQARSVLRESRKVLPSDTFRAMDDDLSWLSGVTGAVRDLDTLIENWSMYERMVEPRDVNRLQIVIREIHFRQTEHRREMCAQLKSQRATTLINDWQVLLINGTEFGKDTRDGQNALAEVVSRRLAKAYQQLLQDCRRINTKSSDDDIHALRKDVKRIRYLAESFSEVVTPNNDDSVLPRLLHLQDSLGQFQDLRIHETAIKDALAYLRPIYTSSTIEAAEELLHQIKTRRRRLRKKVINGVLRA